MSSDGHTSVVRRETPAEYFRELVDAALHHQKISAQELTSYYVVNLLAEFVQLDRASPWGPVLHEEPLALSLARAMESGGYEQRARLRRLGDLSLFISGFFSDSLRRKLVDVDYYISLGGYAYGCLVHLDDQAFHDVFAELSDKFQSFVDVLAEVSERSALSSNTDVLRLYEKWMRTGSLRDGQLLIEKGIVPNASIGSRFVQ